MVSQNSEITRKLRTAVRQKIEEYGIDVDDELPDYVMIMIGNKKDKARMKSDLKLFLGENTTNFVEWLFGFVQNIQKTKSIQQSSLPTSSADVSITEIKEKIDKSTKTTAGTENKSKKNTRNLSLSKPRKQDFIEKNQINTKRKTSASRSRSRSPPICSSNLPRKNRAHEDEDEHRRSDKPSKTTQKTAAETTTTFAVPRPILRSVVVNPRSASLTNHPRIRARTPSPEAAEPIDDFEMTSSNSNNNTAIVRLVEEKRTAAMEMGEEQRGRPHRRVMTAANSSMLFKRAMMAQNSQTITAAKITERKEQPLVNFKEEEKEKVIKEENETANELVIMPDNGDNISTIKEENVKQIQQQQKCKMVFGGRQQQRPLLVGIGAIFQRAIQETKKQNNKIEEEQQRATTTTTIVERRIEKRSLEKEEENLTKKESNESNKSDEKQDVKKIRIDSTEKEIDEDESVLVVNLGKMANRSIQKQSRKPKSSLALLKEHIGHQIEASTGGEKCNKEIGAEMLGNKKQNEGSNIKQKTGIIKEDKSNATNSNKPQQQKFQQSEEMNKILTKTSETKLTIKKSNDGCSKEKSIWDGQIEIEEEDIDETDEDEAEIDAVLKEQNELRKMALQRETEIKRMSLPPTAALTRPIYHHLPALSPISPGEAALLPVTFQQNNSAIISHHQFTSQPQISSMNRPFATVAPCPTPSPTMPIQTTLPTPTTLIVHQQYHQQQNAFSIGHPYNSAVAFMQMPTRPNHPAVGFGYKTAGSISKVYSAPTIHHQTSVNNAAEKSKSLLLQQYSNLLEEQKLLLAQIQKMSNQDERRKNILFKCKQIDKKASELKEQLRKLTEQTARNKDVLTESTSGLLVKRFY